MALLVIDIINSFIQGIIFSYLTEYCLKKENKINKFKVVLTTIIIFAIGSSFTNIWGNLSVCLIIIHTVSLAAIIILYKNNKLRAIIPYTLLYILLGVYVILLNNLFFGVIKNLVPVDYFDIVYVLTLYMPQLLLPYLLVVYRNKFLKLYKLVAGTKMNMITLIIISFCLDFIGAFNLIIYNSESDIFKNTIITILFIFLIVLTKYFAEIKRRSNQIFKLNEALEIKNNELSKIKHDYGAQISYLYGLCLMNRYDDLKQSLKNIINTSETTSTAVEINDNSNSLLSLALKPALDKGIHIIIKGDGDISSSKMPEIELYRIISNIVNNAIRAMNSQGIIIAKVYEQLDSLIIKIENNGPKIKEEHLKKIFEEGFTTKNNDDKAHGFGLNIVKDLIESYSGKISVKSTDTSTEFKMVLPIKQNTQIL